MLVIGIDGGGTNTRACLMDGKGNVLGIGKAGPSSIDTVSLEQTRSSIEQAIMESFIDAKLSQQSLASIFVGLGGVQTETSKKKVTEQLLEISVINDNTIIQVENDAYSAHLGGLSNRPGIILIAGTGSVAFGIDEEGNTHRAGGYGYQEGDHGSSYHLGRRAIQVLTRVFDGRLQKDEFSEELYSALNIQSLDDVLNLVITMHDNRTMVAGLAPIVTKYANKGNALAKQICDEAVEALATCVRAVNNHLSLQNKEIAIIGSLGNSDGYFKDQLHQKLLEVDPAFDIHPPILEPVIGSAKQALRNLKG